MLFNSTDVVPTAGVLFLGITVILIIVEIIYVAFQRPSEMQLLFIIFGIATMVTLVGYIVEILAQDVITAMSAVVFSYFGKPFSMLSLLLLVTSYCGRKPKKMFIIAASVSFWAFPLLILTNSYHHLYYKSIHFNSEARFSGLSIERGPIYYCYMVILVAFFLWSLIVAFLELKESKSKEAKKSIVLVLAALFSTLAGYVVYLTGRTNGYDTTMIGTSVGMLFLTILLFKYRFIDTLSLAQESALYDASNGVMVVGAHGEMMYTNRLVKEYLKQDFTADELMSMAEGEQLITRNGNVYEVSIKTIENRGRDCGCTIEIHDITEKYSYSSKLEKEIEERTEALLKLQRTAISSFANIIEARDRSTGQHVARVAEYTRIIAQSLKDNGYYENELTDKRIACISEVAPLHDVGKISISDRILLKPDKLTAEEFEVIKTHAAYGADIIRECLEDIEEPDYIVTAESVARYHHEKWDGTGYPEKLSGENIPLCARIVAVADVYDAIRSNRNYKKAMSKQEARKIIEDGSGNHFDPMIVTAFVKAIDQIERE